MVIEPKYSSFSTPADAVASFSSRGPSTDMQLKPDLVAPGTRIYSGAQTNDGFGGMYSSTGFLLSQGTSFSAPIVAGAAALIKQAHPSWTPSQVKSALVNTANPAVNEGTKPAAATASGAGRLDLSRALGVSASFDPVGLSFSSWLMGDQVSVRRALTITNLGSAPESYSFEVSSRAALADASVTVAPAQTPAVQPGASTTVEVTFQGPPSVKGSGTLDGRIKVHANNSGADYVVAFWGQVVDSSRIGTFYRIRGNGDVAPVGTLLPRPLAVQVYDVVGVPMARVPVHFEITAGGGSLSAGDGVTDFSGVTTVWLRLPSTAGVVQIRASLDPELPCATDKYPTCAPKVITVTARPATIPVPSLPAAGVVNAASYRQALAPGAIFSIFGNGLAASTETAGSLPLPQTLGSAQVLFDGRPTALFYASPTQINAQVPFELVGAASTQVQVSVGGNFSSPVAVALAQAAPGVFTVSQDGKGAAVVLHALTYTPVTAANPARPGEVLSLFATGLGPVRPFVPTGRPAPPQPLASTTNTINIVVGSTPARVLFSGLAPGFVGLYQVNFEVPAGASLGDSVALNLSVASSSSNPVAVPIR